VPEQHLLELGQVLQTHDQGDCVGQWCAIHRQMPGPWESWPRYWDTDTVRLMRICPCGAEHPVAEMYTWAVASGHVYRLSHVCCGIHPCTPIDGASE